MITARSDRVHVWGLVPAAGLGRRMGGPKQTFPYGESTITATVVATLLDAGVDGVVVVTRSVLRERLRLPDDPRIRTAINDASNSEMIDSIRIGLAALPDTSTGQDDGVLVVPGDMPTLSAATTTACLATYYAEPGHIVVAARGGVRGHPLIFPLALRGEVMGLTGGLRELPWRRADVLRVLECPDAGIVEDMDTPAHYCPR